MAITGYDVLQDVKAIKDIKVKQDKNGQDILDINSHLGDMTQVPTTNKNVSGAITELFTDVSNGKALVGTAITDVDNSVVVPTEPTFGDLASAILRINPGLKLAEGTITSGSSLTTNIAGVTDASGGSSTTYYTLLTVNGLAFKPKAVFIFTELPNTHETINYLEGRDALNGGYNTIYSQFFSSSNNSNLRNVGNTGSEYVTDTGFSFGVRNSNTQFRWVAIG